eukprot:TRINITY_DN1501_c0_g1_i2.p2 TRINITY_DN1501_c0_g1~~TRINITY_DN1501_c0_g1_i2.p2  ORF type:complete len:89 (-),score=1.59 TRINITY_DN1501_c0_g1_i2:34-300(-)
MSMTCCLTCAYDPYNKGVFFITFMSFVLAFVHFMWRQFVAGPPSSGRFFLPSFIAGTSIVWYGSHPSSSGRLTTKAFGRFVFLLHDRF